MALRALMLRKKIDEAKKNLERAQATKAELEKREAELEASIAEAQTDEERAIFKDPTEQFFRSCVYFLNIFSLITSLKFELAL